MRDERRFARGTFGPALSFFLFAFASLACGSSSPGDSPGQVAEPTGVDDVLAACEKRAGWAHWGSSDCLTCRSLATTPHCTCETESYAAVCSSLQLTEDQEPTCSGVTACISACATTDCTCVDACYDGKPACRSAASAVDGCVVQSCASYCQ